MTVLTGSAQGALHGPPSKPREQLPGDKERSHETVVTESRQEYVINFRGAVDGVMTRMPVSYRAYVQGWQPNLFARIENVGDTDVLNPWIAVNGRGDWRTIEGIVAEATRGCKTDAEKARALWEFERTHRFHATTWDNEVKDAVKMHNIFGYTLCGDDAVVLNDLWKAAGLKARRGYPVGHAVTEVFYDGGFHMLDGDEHVICLLRDNKTIASEAQIVADHDLMKRTHTYGISHKEDPLRDQFSASLFPYEGKREGDWGFNTRHKMHFTLRPGESIEWRWDHVGKEYTAGEEMKEGEKWSKNGRGTLRTAWGATAHDNLRNGKWIYRPPLEKALYRKGVVSEENVVLGANEIGLPVLRPAKAGQVARITWKIACPYVMVGGMFSCRMHRKAKGDLFRVQWSADGKTWQDLGEAEGLGQSVLAAALDLLLSPRGKPMYEYFVRLEMRSADGGDVSLRSVWFDTDVQMSLLAMPELTVGANRVRYTDQSKGDRKVQITHAWVDRAQWRPPAPPREPAFPKDGATVDGTRFTFRWPAGKPGTDGATIADYHIQVCDRQDMRWLLSPNFDKLVSLTSSAGKAEWAIPFIGLLNPDTTYYWRVRAEDSHGVWSDWSPPFSFRCAAPGVPVTCRLVTEKGVPTAIAWDDNPTGRKPVAWRVYGSHEQGFTASDSEYLVRMGRGFCQTMEQYKAKTEDGPFSGNVKTPANFIAETKERRFELRPQSPDKAIGDLLAGSLPAFYRVVAVDAKGNASGPSDLVCVPRPFIYTAAPPGAKVGQVYRYRPAATFSIGHLTCRNGYNAAFWQRETLTWTLESGPSWLRVTDGELTGTPGGDDAGSREVVLKVISNTGGAAEQRFRMTIGK